MSSSSSGFGFGSTATGGAYVEGGFFSTSSGSAPLQSRRASQTAAGPGDDTTPEGHRRRSGRGSTLQFLGSTGGGTASLPYSSRPLNPTPVRDARVESPVAAAAATAAASAPGKGGGDLGEGPPIFSLLDGGDDFGTGLSSSPYGSERGPQEDFVGVAAGGSGLRQRKGRQSVLGETELTFTDLSNGLQLQPSHHGEWVVVHGFPPGSSDSILDLFHPSGEVMEQRMGEGNWLFLRFATRLQADKAVASGNGAILPGGIMLGARRLDPSEVSRMGVDGSLAAGGGRRRVSLITSLSNPLADPRHVAHMGEVDDSDLFLEAPRRRQGNICQRFMSWLLS